MHEHYIPHGYVHINQDILQTRQKCIHLCTQSIQLNQSVVIDRTHATMEQRAYFITLAKQYNIYCKIIELRTPVGIARRLNAVRSIIGSTYQINKRIVPDAAFYRYMQQYESPDQQTEQVNEHIVIPFVPKFNEREIELFDTVQVK